MKVQFTEKESKVASEQYFTLPIAHQKLVIQFPSTKSTKTYFKAGLPYFGKLHVQRPDYEPAVEESIKVCYEARTQPWVAVESGEKCSQYTVDAEGKIHYQLPPFEKEVKQVLVKAHPEGHPEQTVAFSLRPWYTESETSVLLRKPSQEKACGKSVQLQLLAKNVQEQAKSVYYQVIGRGAISAPIKTDVAFAQWKQDQEQTVGQEEGDNADIKAAQLEVQLPEEKFSLNPLTRVIVYFKDEQDNLVADSATFWSDCMEQDIDLDMEEEGGQMIQMKLRSPQGSHCALEMSRDEKRSQAVRDKITKVLERFDLSHEYLLQDKCERQRIENMKSRKQQQEGQQQEGQQQEQEQEGQQDQERQDEKPHASHLIYRESVLSPSRQTVLDYADAWDIFNEAGLSVASNQEMDNSPCEWEVYPEGIPAETLKGMEADRALMWRTVSKEQSDAQSLLKAEASLIKDLLFWNSQVEDGEYQQQVSNDEAQAHANVLCLNHEQGLLFATKKYERSGRQFTLKTQLSERATIGDSVPVKVVIKKHTEKCLPIKITLKSSSRADQTDSAIEECICGQETAFDMKLKPRSIGTSKVTVKASKSSIGCENSESFSQSQEVEHEIRVHSHGVANRKTTTQLLCGEEEENKHELKETGSKRGVIVSDLIHIALKEAQESLASERSALDVLSAFAPPLYRTSSQGLSEQLKEQLKEQMATAYQSLITYRLPDGSYSLFGGRKAAGDLPLTVAIVKVLSQAKDLMPYTNDQDLARSIHWIYSRQLQDGSFYSPRRDAKVWPLSLEGREVTAYVVSSLLEAGHSIDNIQMANALKNVRDAAKSEQSEVSQLTYAMLAFIEAQRGEVEEAEYHIQKAEKLADHQTEQKEIEAYMTLAKILLGQDYDKQHVAEHLLSHQDTWKSPIAAYTLFKVWPRLQPVSSIRVQYEDSSFEVEPYGQQDFDIKSEKQSLRTHGRGCAAYHTEKSQQMTSRKNNNFKVTVEGLERGFGSCQNRKMRLCIKERKHANSSAPIVRLQLVSGFHLNAPALRQQLLHQEPNLLNHFHVSGRQVYLYLKFLRNPSVKSQCLEVPLIQKEQVTGRQEGYMQVYDYHQGYLGANAAVDNIEYTIPEQCQVEEGEEQGPVRRSFQEMRRLRSTQGQQSVGPLRLIECPKGTVDSCPVCKKYERRDDPSICAAEAAGPASRLPWRHTDYESMLKTSQSAHKGKCVAIPLFVQKSHKNEARNYHLYMKAECQCQEVVQEQRNLYLTRSFPEQAQLTSGDHIYKLSSQSDGPRCQPRSSRNKRSVANAQRLAECKLPTPKSCPDFMYGMNEEVNKKACNNFPIAAIVEFKDGKNGCPVVVAKKVLRGSTLLAENREVPYSFDTLCNNATSLVKEKVLLLAKDECMSGDSLKINNKVMLIRFPYPESLNCADLPQADSYGSPAYGPTPASYPAPAAAYSPAPASYSPAPAAYSPPPPPPAVYPAPAGENCRTLFLSLRSCLERTRK